MKRIGTVVILTAILLMTACSRRDTGSSVADSGMTKIQNVDNSHGSKTDDQPEITQNADNRNGSKTEGWAEVSQNAENSNGSTTDDKAEVTQDIDSSIGNNADGAEGNKADTAIEDGYSLEGDEFATEVTEEEIGQLREIYPRYFDLPCAKGLEVYVWEMAEGRYSCGVMMGTNRVKFEDEFLAMRGVSVDVMRKILASYGIGDDYIFVGYCQHPLSSYVPLDVDAENAKIRAMFSDLPKIVGTDEESTDW